MAQQLPTSAATDRPKGGKAPQAPHVERGDHLYVNHPKRGPVAVQVRAVGKDGVTGTCDQGKTHQVRWPAVLGHKARVSQSYQVHEQGADGAIVTDSAGRRRYVAGDTTAEPEAEPQPKAAKPRDPLTDGIGRLTKCLHRLHRLHRLAAPPGLPGGRYLLLKATPNAAVAGRPGLTLRDMTDAKGRHTKHWVRSAKNASAVIHDPRQVDVEHLAGEAKQPAEPAFRGTSDPKPATAPRQAAQPATGVIKDRRQPDLLGGGEPAPRKAPTMKHGQSVRFQHGQVEGQGKIVSSGADGVTVEDAQGELHQVRHEALLGPGPGSKAN